MTFDLIVIGQGYAGLCAARFARQRRLSVAVFERVMAGGAVQTVLTLAPSPESFTNSGPDLAAIVGMENIDLGVKTFLEPVTELRPGPFGGWVVVSPAGTFRARDVIFATGGRPRMLGVPGELELAGKGISRCAHCDGPEVVGRDCVVIGGGDAAFQEAEILSHLARSVTIMMRGEAPSARRDLVEAALASTRVTLLAGCRATAILGVEEDRVTGIRYRSDDGAQGELLCDRLFLFLGVDPDTALLPPAIARDRSGALVVDAQGAMAEPGLWAIGAVRSGYRGGLHVARDDAERAVAAI